MIIFYITSFYEFCVCVHTQTMLLIIKIYVVSNSQIRNSSTKHRLLYELTSFFSQDNQIAKHPYVSIVSINILLYIMVAVNTK